jgi:hypothetical protein
MLACTNPCLLVVDETPSCTCMGINFDVQWPASLYSSFRVHLMVARTSFVGLPLSR